MGDLSAAARAAGGTRRRTTSGKACGRRVLRHGLWVGAGLLVAVASAGAAWYLTIGAAQWLAGGLLAGLALACSVFAIITLLRESLAETRPGDVNLLFTALDMAAHGRVITDENGLLTYANPAYRAMTETVRGDPPSPVDLVQGDAAAMAAMTRLLDLARKGGRGQETVRLALPKGTRWLRFVASDTGSGPGNGGRNIIWQVVDVTNPDAVRDGNDQTRLVAMASLDAAGYGGLMVDDAMIITAANGTLMTWLGAGAAPLVGQRLDAVLAGSVTAGGRAAERLPGLVGQRLPFRDGAGRARALQVIGADSLDLNGSPGRAGVLILCDAEHAGQRDAARSEPLSAGDESMRFRRYFADAPVGIATVDLDGRIYESNALFQRAFPEFPEQARHHLSEMIVANDLGDVLKRIREAIETDDVPAPADVRFLGGQEKQAQLYAHRLEAGADDEGAARAVLYIIDVTDQKNLEMQFAQSQKMQAVGQLAGGIAHDFNNLLTAITGFCDLLLVRHGPGDQSFADIMQVKQNANRAANLVRQLLAFSRQQTLRPKVLIITDVLAEISNLLRRLIGETIELKMIHGRSLGPVKVDQGQLEQVIINLAVNARDAMAGGGTLTIRTANIGPDDSHKLGHAMMPAGAYVMIEVSDTGIGIEKENLGKIFEPFFSTKEVGKGTGLGLSTVYGIVKQTGGFIFPASVPGEGAVFRIYLPMYAGAEDADALASAPPPERARDLTGKGNILLVEDEDAVRLFACRALRNKGYNVLEASSGEQALELVETHGSGINLLISDVVMPNMDGPTLVKNIRERRYGMKIIFISGYAEDAFRKNLGKEAEFSFLPKPFSLKQLAEKVKEVLEEE